MDLPRTLAHTDAFPLQLGTTTVNVPLCSPQFQAAPVVAGIDRFGGKDLVLVDGRPQFAEVAILCAFEREGWEGRWVETYGKPRMKPGLWREWQSGGPRAQEHVPIAEDCVNERLRAIADANGGTYGGCWDVIAWKGARLVFAESKKWKKDCMRHTQLRWLAAALACGVTVEDVLVVEWSLDQ